MEYVSLQQINPVTSDAIKEAFISKMDKEYNLIYIDYRDNFNDSGSTIQDCLDNNSPDELYNDDWESDASREGSDYSLKELKSSILKDSAYLHLHSYIDEWLEDDDNKDLIRDMIEDRDKSTPYADMIAQSKLRGRATLFTNYDCLPDNYNMGNTYCYDEYFRDIVDVLHLNPAKVRSVFHDFGIDTEGKWLNKKKRDGNEAVSYEDLATEMLNQCCYGLLTFMGMLPLADLYKNSFEKCKAIIIPKDNLCGMFSHWNGGGSLMEMKLLRDLTIPVYRPGKTEYDRFEMIVDEPNCGRGYCINEVYGMNTSVWGNEFKPIFK